VVTESERQAIVDEEHLRMLPVFYWVLGATECFLALYGLVYVGLGVFFASIPAASSSSSAGPPPAFIASLFVAIGAGFMIVFGAVGVLTILTGFWIRKRRHRTACLVMAGLSCLSVPWGTIVGVFSFIVLLSPSVKALFDSGSGGSGAPQSGQGVIAPSGGDAAATS
jgi:hypothetical protein